MKTEQALEVVRSLADGVDPSSGEPLPVAGPVQQPQVIRALMLAARALEQQAARVRRQSRQPGQSGRPWTEDEDARLLRGFDEKQSMSQLAEAHQRTSRAIQLRLLKLGRLNETG